VRVIGQHLRRVRQHLVQQRLHDRPQLLEVCGRGHMERAAQQAAADDLAADHRLGQVVELEPVQP
jgi:hypothetical protein